MAGDWLPGDEPPKRSDLVTAEKALRQDWLIPPEVRRKVLQRAIDIVDPETKIGKKATRRDICRAMQIITLFGRLTIQQQALDLQRSKLTGDGDESLKLSDLVADAERRADEYRADERPV